MYPVELRPTIPLRITVTRPESMPTSVIFSFTRDDTAMTGTRSLARRTAR